MKKGECQSIIEFRSCLCRKMPENPYSLCFQRQCTHLWQFATKRPQLTGKSQHNVSICEAGRNCQWQNANSEKLMGKYWLCKHRIAKRIGRQNATSVVAVTQRDLEPAAEPSCVSTHQDALSGLQKVDKLIQSVGHYHRTKESTYFTCIKYLPFLMWFGLGHLSDAKKWVQHH